MQVLPPFAVYQSDRLTEAEWPAVAEAYRRRITGLFSDPPIPYRTQNGGHYDGQQVLKPGLGAGESGTRIHLVQQGDPKEVLDGSSHAAAATREMEACSGS
jgi:NAD(P)H dehydrogenase (quinone)